MRAIFNQELKQLGSDLESMANQVATAKNTRLNPTDAGVLSHPVTGETAVEKLTAPVRGIPKNVPIDK